MNSRLWRTLTLSALTLLGVTMACTNAGASGTTPIGVVARPTIGPNRPPNGPAVYEVAQTTTLAGTSPGPASATCPQGEVALAGGWSIPSPASVPTNHLLQPGGGSVAPQDTSVYEAMLSGSTWAVYVKHAPLRVTQTIAVTAYVECLAHVPGAVVTGRTATDNVLPTSTFPTGFEALCNPNEVPVGFGFDFSAASTALEFAGSNPLTLDPVLLWNFSIWNHDTVAHTASLSVECLTSSAVSLGYPATRGGPVAAGATRSLQQSCPAGYVAAGGGINYENGDGGTGGSGEVFLQHAITSNGFVIGWQGAVFVATTGPDGVFANLAAVCLSF